MIMIIMLIIIVYNNNVNSNSDNNNNNNNDNITEYIIWCLISILPCKHSIVFVILVIVLEASLSSLSSNVIAVDAVQSTPRINSMLH